MLTKAVQACAVIPRHPLFLHVIILVFLFLTRYYTLFYHYESWDEAAMMTEAWAMTKGQVLYRDIYQVHPMFQFFIFIPFFWIFPNYVVPFAVKLMNAALIYLGAILIRRILLALYKDSWTAFLSAILFVCYLGCFSWARSSHGEFYTLFPVLASVLLIVRREKVSRFSSITVGLLWGVAFFIKQVAIFDIFAVWISFLLAMKKPDKIGSSFLFMVGITLATLIAAIYPLYHSTLNESVQAILLHNPGSYATAKAGSLSLWERVAVFGMNYVHVIRHFLVEMLQHPIRLVLGLAPILLWVPAKLTGKSQAFPGWTRSLLFSSIWILTVLAGIALIGRFYPHYLIQMATAAILFYSAWVDVLPAALKRISVLVIVVLCFFASGKVFLKERRVAPHVRALVQRSMEVADYIETTTSRESTLFLYQVHALDIFYLSRRLSPNGIYMYIDMDAAHTNDPAAENANRMKLQADLPDVIARGPYEVADLPTHSTADAFFGELIERNYKLRAELKNIRLYYLKETIDGR